MVVFSYLPPFFNTVEGKEGQLGEFGKACVSKQMAQCERYAFLPKNPPVWLPV